MTDLQQWLDANDKYLAAALAWLRLCLYRLAGPETAAATFPITPSPSPQPTSWWSFRRQTAAQPDTSILALPLPSGAVSEEQITQAVKAMSADEATEPPPALITLSQRLGLSRFEREVLLLCVAMELDTGFPALCARAQHDVNKPYPTFSLALTLFEDPAWDVMSPERPLRYWRLIEINQPGAQLLVTSALKADERVVNYAKGLNYLDDRLAPLMAIIAPEDDPLPLSQQRIANGIFQQLERSLNGLRLPIFQLLGADSRSKSSIAQRTSARLGLTLYRLAADAIATQSSDQETFLRLWQRESALLPIALYIDATQLERTGNPHTAFIHRLVSRVAGPIFFETREPWGDLGREAILLDVAKPTPAEQQEAWTASLGEQGKNEAPRLAGYFNFNIATIKESASAASAASKNDPDALSTILWADCLRRSRPSLDQLAQPLEPKAFWDDLELPASEKSLLRHIADQVERRTTVYDDWGFRARMNRGLGISVLFAGESGTGKTMAAEVIANELKLLLYRIDLSAVVNKYIGETEKNLRKLFDAAEDGGAILLFDEADALFGKRSEVKDSHDRYANIEINYLLQRMEAFRGLAILATNMKSALDSAFLRRLRFIVNFPFPGPAERMAIWQKVFPPQLRTKGLDFQRLARLSVPGGCIHNIALNAAFLAARAGTDMTMPLILEAARIEFRKLEKPINEADFRWLETAGASA
jgi:hypothetical protein